MTRRNKTVRFLVGTALLLALLVIVFALLPLYTQTWGATTLEIARDMPGDEMLDNPTLVWNHGITIDGSADEVWPWVAQIGDVRGGFYSYTFIENLIAGESLYHNADRILPQFQDPQPGDGMIDKFFLVHSVESGRYLLGHLTGVPGMRFVWLWHVSPEGQDLSRLHVRMGIGPPPEMSNPMFSYVIDVTGFVMERRMMVGIKDRVEGRVDPPFSEGFEIILWLTALGIGIAAGVMYVRRDRWQAPLAIALLSVTSLLAFTYLQPRLWARGVVDAVLLAATVLIGVLEENQT